MTTFLLLACGVVPSWLQAQTTLFWDNNGTSSGLGGTGTWDTTTASRWSTASTGTSGTYSAWSNITTAPNNATFSGTAGIVTTGAPVRVGNITFGVSSYTIAGNATNTISLGGTTTTAVSIDTGTFSDTISGVLAGSASLTKTGIGTLTLSGANTYTGATTISQGTLALGANAGNLTNGALGNAGTAVTINDANTSTNATGLTIAASGVTVNRGINVANSGSGTVTLGGDASLTSGTGSFTGTVTANRSVSLQAAGTSNITFGTYGITGAGGITKIGTGTVTLSGANSYAGGTTLSAGTLALGSTAALGSTGTISFGGGTLQFSSANATDYSSRFSTAASQSYNLDTNGQSVTLATGLTSSGGSLTKGGSGTLTLSGTNTYSGATTINGGTLQLGSAGALGSTSGVTVASGASFDLNGQTDNKATTINGSGVSANSGALTNSSSTGVTASSTVTLGSNASIGGAGDITLSSGLAGNFKLSKVGTDTVTLNGSAGTRTGGAQIDAGTLKLGSTAALGAAGQTVTLNGGTLDLATNTSTNAYLVSVAADSTVLSDRASSGSGITHTLGALSIGSNVLSVDSGSNVNTDTNYGLTFGATTLTGNATFNIDANGTGVGTLTLGALGDGNSARTITKTGLGTLTLGTNATSLVTGTAVTISAGILNSNSTSALGSLANVTVGPVGSFGIGASQTIGALNGSTAGSATNPTVTLGSNTLTIGSSNNLSSSFAGVISGTGNIVKAGTGTLTLSGTNTYTGHTTINAGVLKFSDDSNLGAAPVSATAGSLTLGGGSLDATATGVTLNSNRGIALTTSTTSNLTAEANSSLSYAGIIAGAGNLTVGTVGTGTGTVTLTGPNTYTGTTSINAGTLAINTIGNVSGGSSNLGAPTSTTNGTIKIGSGTTGATLKYLGSGSTTNRVIDMSGTTGGATLDASGSGALVLNGNVTATGAGAKTLSLIGSSTANNTISGVIADNSSTNKTSLVKSDSGKWVLSGTAVKTYTGSTTVNGGTLQLDFNSLGTPTNLVNSSSALVLGGGTLDVKGKTGASVNSSQTFNGLTVNAGASAMTRTTNTGNSTTVVLGAITRNVGGTVDFAAAGSGNITTSTTNNINNGILGGWATVGGTSWAVSGNSGTNSITALTSYTNNSWATANNTTVAASTSVTNNSTTNSLRFNNAGALTVTLNGGTNTITTGGILVTNAVGNNNSTITGANLRGKSGADLIVINNNTNASGSLTINSAIVDNSTATGLTKSGVGALILGGTNTYTGATTINQGTLRLGANNVLANTTNLNLTSSTAVFDVNGKTDTVGSLTGAAGSSITLGSNGALTTSTNSSTTFDGTISGAGSLTKSGTGTLTLSAANTFSGGLTVSAGTVLGTGTTNIGGFAAFGNYSGIVSPTTVITVNSGATLAVQSSYLPAIADGSFATTLLQNISISGSGVSGGGAIRAQGGTNTWNGNISLAADATITNAGSAGDPNLLYLGPWSGAAPTALTLNNHTVTFGGPGDVYVNSAIGASTGDTGGVIINGTSPNSVVYFGGPQNYYTGTTQVNDGNLEFQVNPGNHINSAIKGDLIIGDGIGSANTAVVRYYQSMNNQIADNVHVTINSDGKLDLSLYGGVVDTLGHITLNGGHIDSTNGLLYLGGVVSGNDIDVTDNSIIDGNLSLNNFSAATRIINVAAGKTLTLNADLFGNDFSKEGTGTMTMTFNNFGNGYTGKTEIKDGTLLITNSGALGGTGGGSLSSGTKVYDGATLQLQGGLSVPAENLILNGAGFGSAGALDSVSGTNSIAGNITLGSVGDGGTHGDTLGIDTTINTDAGSLTLTGAVTGSGTSGVTQQNLIVGGGGNTTISGPIGDGTGGGFLGINKVDTGTLTLNGVDTFTGAISIANSGGTLAITANNVLGAHTNTVDVGTSATFALSGGGNATNTIGKLTGTGLVSIAASTNLVVNTATADTFSGTLSGAGLFEKQGAGTFTFASAANTSAFNFAGTVQLTAANSTDTLEFQGGSGTLNTSTNALSIGTLNLTGGTLLLTNAYINVGTLNITGDTILDFGTGARSILNATNIYIAAGVVVTVKNWSSETDFLFANSDFRVNNGSGQISIRNQIGTGGSFTPEDQVWFQGDPQSPDGSHTTWIDNTTNYYNYADHEIRPVPEPSTYGAIFLAASLGLLGWTRFRRSRKSIG